MQVELPARRENYSLCVCLFLVLIWTLVEFEIGEINVLKPLEIGAQVHVKRGGAELLRRVNDRSDEEFSVRFRVDQALGNVDIRKQHIFYSGSGRLRSSA